MKQSLAVPKTCKAAVIHDMGQPLHVEDLPVPAPIHGSVLVRVHSAPVYGPWKALLTSGHRPDSFMSHPEPFVPSRLTVGRIAVIGPDTTTLSVDQLVVTDYFIRARDNPDGVQFLGSFTTLGNPRADKPAEIYRNGGWAEYMLVAHENCHGLDERLFLGDPAQGGLGYKIEQLALLPCLAIVYAGLRDIDLKAGEKIVIAPATGVYGGAAVEVASAMGARVIACGRNNQALKDLADNIRNVKTVQLTGNIITDTAAIIAHHGPVECFQDLSPPTIPNTNHISAAFGALATYGRASMMGSSTLDIPLNYGPVVSKSLTIKGRFMYDNNSVRDLIKLVAAGGIKLGRVETKNFSLEQWREALDAAEENHGWGKLVSIAP